MASMWSDEEILKLIELWGDEEIQALLEGCTRNRHVYEKVVEGMKEAGYDKSCVQCRDKIKKLRGEYRKIKDNNKETGRNRKNLKFYDPLNEILASRPTTQPAVVIDSLLEVEEVMKCHEENGEEGSAEGQTNEGESDKGGMGQGGFAEDEGETELGKEKCDTEKGSQREQKEVGDVAKGTNKRKRSTKEDKFAQALQTVVDKVTQAQKESDMLFLKLEEKRMKFDERMMEMEDRRLREDKEREERQRQEDRDFQLRMLMMQHSRAPPPPPPHFPPGFNYSFHNSSSNSESSQWPDPDVS